MKTPLYFWLQRIPEPGRSQHPVLLSQERIPGGAWRCPPAVPPWCPFLSFLHNAHARASLVPPKRAHARTNYTGCGFQFYISWPLLALIILINQRNPLEMMKNLGVQKEGRGGGEKWKVLKTLY